MKSKVKFILFFFLIALSQTLWAKHINAIDTLNQLTTRVDSVGPVVNASIAFKHINLKNYQSNISLNKVTVFPRGSELTVAGADTAGMREIYISLDNASESLYHEPIRLIARGRHTARIRAIDALGNETLYSFDYIINE